MQVSLYMFIIFSLVAPHALDAESTSNDDIILTIDFSHQPPGSAQPWLQQHGFSFWLDAHHLNPRFEDQALILSTDGELAGMIGKQFAPEKYLDRVKRVRIEWGVYQYPIGADWESGVNRVPIAVILTFGTRKWRSGIFPGFKPSPYFLSPFIGLKEKEGKEYVGKYYRKGGRYYCVASGDRTGQTIITDFEVDNRFKHAFQESITPPITSFALQMNTKDTQGGAKAFLRKIEFLSK
ncbi:hypothetical protein C2W62_22710 [Candidatus Entotheonella serta]|nr:hypothetical protein C2W62_22710 [Candidatus Entotheonella serta]